MKPLFVIGSLLWFAYWWSEHYPHWAPDTKFYACFLLGCVAAASMNGHC